MTTTMHAAPLPVTASGARWRRRASLAQDALLVVFFAYTAYFHGHAFLTHGLDRLPSLFYGIEQSLLFGIWITRRRSYGTTPRIWDWVVAAGGSWLIYLVRPGDAASTELFVLGTVIQCIGLVLTIVAISYLGKSFGIVAANRGLKVNGPYRVVRHPVYFAHTVSSLGFVLANPSTLNLTILGVVTAFQVLRIQSEERWLRQTANYGEYAQRVRWRLLPGLY